MFKRDVVIMLTVRLPEKIESVLGKMAKESGHTKSSYVIKALERYFQTYGPKIEEAVALMQKEKTLSFEEARQKINFWNDDLSERET